MPKKQSNSVPRSMEPFYSAIVQLTDAVCNEHLNSEYAALARYMAAALARKRPSPIVRGKPATWACGIVYTLGSLNYLFDTSRSPSMRMSDLCALFGLSRSSGASKSKFIRDSLGIDLFSAEWCLPSRMEENPFFWMVQVNGLIVDIRGMPREIQVAAFEKGLIPYVPADQQQGE